MTSRSHVMSESATMLRRNLRHMRRYPSLTLFIAGIPVVLLLLFVYVFGGTLGAGIGGVAVGRDAYLAYVIPGILLMTLAGVAQGTAISVAIDMTEGIVGRFRTMAISRAGLPFESIDGEPVHVIVLLISPPDRPGDHLRALENVVNAMRDENFVKALRAAPTKDDIWKALNGGDGAAA